MSANGKCTAINKNNISQCKKNAQIQSIFCAIHNKSNPKYVAININAEDTLNKQDDNYIWKLIDFKNINDTTNEINIERDKIIKNIKDEIAKAESERQLKEKWETEELRKIRNCGICFDEFEPDDLIRCDKTTYNKQHFSCKECLLGHIDSLLTDGIASVDCAFKGDKCGGVYCEKNIETVITDGEKLEKWKTTYEVSEILKMASICNDYIVCPLCCKWGCIFEIPPGIRQNFYIKCGRCNEEFCNTCKRKAHGKRSCNELVFEEGEPIAKKIETIDRLLQDIITNALMHCCTSCGTSYVKLNGCNLIICEKCGGMSCYLCNAKLYIKNNSKYTHFKDHDLSDPDAKCELWNNKAGEGTEGEGNARYNHEKIIEKIVNFIFSNNMEVSKLIVDRLKILFKDDKEYKEFVIEMENMFVN